MRKVIIGLFLCVVLLVSLASVDASAGGGMTYHPIPLSIWPCTINNQGQIAGATFDGYPAIWHNGQIVRMPFGTKGTAGAINDAGNVIVAADNGSPKPEYLFVDKRGWVSVINVPGDYDVVITINNRNQVIGATYAGTTRKCFLWQHGRVNFLNDSGYWWPYCINNRGQIVVGDGSGGNFVWQNGRINVIETPDNGVFTPRAINDAGKIVGSFAPYDENDWTCEHYPAYWYKGELTMLDALGQQGVAVAINNRGDILGYTEEAANAGFEHLVLWREGRPLIYIDENISQPFELDRHHLISIMNNRGQIVCNGFLDGQFGFYLLQPRRR